MTKEEIKDLIAERSYRLSDLKIDQYRIKCLVSQGQATGIDSLEYQKFDVPITPEDAISILRVVNNWAEVILDGDIFTDRQLIAQLESVRKYSVSGVDGLFIIFNPEDSPIFRVCKSEEAMEFYENSVMIGTPKKEFKEWAEHRRFYYRNNLLRKQVSQNNGKLTVVKLITLGGQEVDLDTYSFAIDKMIRGTTGIPEVDNLFPFGSTEGSIVHGTFFFGDEAAASGVWNHAPVKYDTVYQTKPKNSPVKLFTFDDKTWYSIPDSRFMGLLPPKTLKKLLMPGQDFGNPNYELRGPVLSLPEYDGIVAFMPSPFFSTMIKNGGFDSRCTAIKITCPFAKGIIRELPEVQFYSRFGKLPVWANCIFIEASLDKDAHNPNIRHAEYQKTCRNEKCDAHGLFVPMSKEECDVCGHTLSESPERWLACPNQACGEFGISIGLPASKVKEENGIKARYSELPPPCKCGARHHMIRVATIEGEHLGCHDSDLRGGRSNGKVSHQIVARGGVNRELVKEHLTNQLHAIEELSAKILMAPNSKGAEVELEQFMGDDVFTTIKPAKEVLLEVGKIKAEKSDSTIRGTNSLLSAGIYPGFGRVIDKVKELIGSMLMAGKMRIELPAIRIKDNTGTVRKLVYGAKYVVPGIGLADDEVRVPKSMKEIIMEGTVVLARYPIRPGNTEMSCLKVVGESHGNVIEVHPERWARKEGDFDGDTGNLFPVWIVGRCKQDIVPEIHKTKAAYPESVEEIILLNKKAYRGKMMIGMVDSRATDIQTEFECLGTPLTNEEIHWLREEEQRTLNSIKHVTGVGTTPPTVRMVKAVSQRSLKNPINDLLYYRPQMGRKPPASMLDFSALSGIPCPGRYDNFRWVKFLQAFGAYLMTHWVEQNRAIAYRVENHPYRDIVETFVTLNIKALETPITGLEDMYRAAFVDMYNNSFERILQSCAEDMEDIVDIITFLQKKDDEYKKLCTRFKGHEGGDLEWAQISAWIAHQRRLLDEAIGVLANGDLVKYTNISNFVYSSLQAPSVQRPSSLVWWIAPTGVIIEMVRIYEESSPSGLDHVSNAYVTEHLIDALS